jgi:hypothetical protein
MVDLGAATPLADAVLFEGYVLYPYRANDAKNRVRWQFGVLMPQAFAELDPSERAWLQTDTLVEGRDAVLTVRVRFLHVRERTVEVTRTGSFARVASLDVGAATYLACDEATVHETDVEVTLPALDATTVEHDLAVPGGQDIEILRDDGTDVGRLVRTWQPLAAHLQVQAEPFVGPYGVRRVRVRLDNRTPWTASVLGPGPTRPDALRSALVAAHAVIGVDGARFVSQLEPPEWARGYVASCENVGAFPVLVGPPDSTDLVLASPIILYDHAEVAPESEVAFCDATEMDEMLTLRAMTLTDEEKRQARGSDPRAASIIDHVDNLPPELMDRLHGAIRSMSAIARPSGLPDLPIADIDRPPWWDPGEDASVDPETDEILVDGVSLRRGVQVRLRPGSKRADAQDMFLEGRLAHVEAVLNDVDGQTHLAVALDDLGSLAGDGVNPHGRFLYFAPDEVEPVEVDA